MTDEEPGAVRPADDIASLVPERTEVGAEALEQLAAMLEREPQARPRLARLQLGPSVLDAPPGGRGAPGGGLTRPAFVVAAAVDDDLIALRLADGRVVACPTSWSRRLSAATPEQRDDWEVEPGGLVVAWPRVDEHIGVWTLLRVPEAEAMDAAAPAEASPGEAGEAVPGEGRPPGGLRGAGAGAGAGAARRPKSRARRPGAWEGRVELAPDFDEPPRPAGSWPDVRRDALATVRWLYGGLPSSVTGEAAWEGWLPAERARWLAEAVAALEAEHGAIPVEVAAEAVAQIAADRRGEPRGSVTCPVCGLTSRHPFDVRERFCRGRCWDYTSAPPTDDPAELRRRAEMLDPGY